MVSDCKDYEQKGYCLLGRSCPLRHGRNRSDHRIELDISGYAGLLEVRQRAITKFHTQTREEQAELKRKQTDLLSTLISQQRNLIEKIDLCQDDAEKSRLKSLLDEMSQKTKDWIEEEGARSKRDMVEASKSQQRPSQCTPVVSPSTSASK